jgi:hypothetical protein
VHGEIAPAVTEQQAAEFAWMVRDTLDQYLAVAKKNGFTKAQAVARPARLLPEAPRAGRLDPQELQP